MSAIKHCGKMINCSKGTIYNTTIIFTCILDHSFNPMVQGHFQSSIAIYFRKKESSKSYKALANQRKTFENTVENRQITIF